MLTLTKAAIPQWLTSEMSRKGKVRTQAWLAKKAEIDQTYVSDIKLGKRIPSIEVIKNIAYALTVDDDYETKERVLREGLLARRKDTEGQYLPEIERIPDDARRLWAGYNNAPPHRKQVIDEMLGLNQPAADPDDSQDDVPNQDDPPVRDVQ